MKSPLFEKEELLIFLDYVYSLKILKNFFNRKIAILYYS